MHAFIIDDLTVVNIVHFYVVDMIILVVVWLIGTLYCLGEYCELYGKYQIPIHETVVTRKFAQLPFPSHAHHSTTTSGSEMSSRIPVPIALDLI